MKNDLSYLCREAKEQHVPRLTNSDLAQLTGVSENAVAQFLRGETKNASVYTVGRICAALGVSLDQFFAIQLPASAELQSLSDELQQLCAESNTLREKEALYKKSLRMHRITTLVMLGLLTLVIVAIVIDFFIPAVGWIR